VSTTALSDAAAGAIVSRIADTISAGHRQVAAAIVLLDSGASVPFIARYRKEATGGLDDNQLRLLEERLIYLREFEARRQTILDTLREQGQLTAPLQQAIAAAETKQRLEDLYLPYRKKRRTKGQIAREAGLAPLVDALRGDPRRDPLVVAAAYLETARAHGMDSIEDVLEAARHLWAEELADDADLSGRLRSLLRTRAILTSTLIDGMADEGAKFADYFNYAEALERIPSHRALALLRGRREKVLRVTLTVGVDDAEDPGLLGAVAAHCAWQERGRPADSWTASVMRLAWRIKIRTRLETELLADLRERAEDEAIQVFARNLSDLLLAPPAGPRRVMGIDPGIRTGCKIAIIDATGKLLDTATVYPLPPQRDREGALATLTALAGRHRVELVAVGNGTGSRETMELVNLLKQTHPALRLTVVSVSEAGASVYSASDRAAREFPDLDVSLRGAVSIARRLQDPLAELVKIEPKAIGVGQYQHDVSQVKLGRSLEAVVEDCVNAVGVDVNTASTALLSHVSGLTPTIAEQLVGYRNQHGAFPNREALMAVPRLGEKTFEQAAGFLRIRNGTNPLDASAVHPESYPVVERLLRRCGKPLSAVIGNQSLLQTLNAADLVDRRFGEPTVRYILRELEKPGRDPRPAFVTVRFRDGVTELRHVEPGMWLEGVVTNVTNFGAFVDVGVHQDGLVHVSQLADRFIKDPHSVVKSGQVVKVRVVEVDLQRRRISLSLRDGDPRPPPGKPSQRQARNS
jgi:protein Tex